MDEKLINVLAEKLKVTPEKLQSATSFEELGTPVKYMFDDAGYNALTENVKKTGYGEGKKAGEEMLFKSLRNSYQEDDSSIIAMALKESQSLPETFVKLSELHKTKTTEELERLKQDLTGNVDERIGEWKEKYTQLGQTYQKEKSALQKLIEEKENILKQKELEFSTVIKTEKLNNLYTNEFQVLRFEVPQNVKSLGNDAVGQYQRTQLQNAIKLFKSTYEADFNENGQPVFVDRITKEPVLDETMNPLPMSKILPRFAQENFLPIIPIRSNGRGDGDDNFSSTSLGKIRNVEQFTKYCETKGISPHSKEGIAIFSEIKAKNPNFNT